VLKARPLEGSACTSQCGIDALDEGSAKCGMERTGYQEVRVVVNGISVAEQTRVRFAFSFFPLFFFFDFFITFVDVS
jgi:hypothetical protein